MVRSGGLFAAARSKLLLSTCTPLSAPLPVVMAAPPSVFVVLRTRNPFTPLHLYTLRERSLSGEAFQTSEDCVFFKLAEFMSQHPLVRVSELLCHNDAASPKGFCRN